MPTDEFLKEVEQVMTWIGAGATGKLGHDLYEKVKGEILKRRREVKAGPRIVVFERESRDSTRFLVGGLRPVFRIGKGNALILKNLTIVYRGSPANIFEEDEAPSFYLVNVKMESLSPAIA